MTLPCSRRKAWRRIAPTKFLPGPKTQLVPIKGPVVTHPASIDARQVVWVGIPTRWVEDRVGASAMYESHFVGGATRFVKIKDTVRVRRTIEAARDAAAEAEQVVQAVQVEQVQAVRTTLKPAVGEAPPWFVPDWLA